MSDESSQQAVPGEDEGAASPYPVDSATRPCCGGIGAHTPSCADVVARAKAVLVEHLTPAPWVVNTEGWAVISSGSDSVFHGYFEGHCGDCGEQVLDAATVAIAIEDAEFIAAARSLVPELVAEVERLRALVPQDDDRVALDRQYTDEELRNSPYIGAFEDAVVVKPDEYRSGPAQLDPADDNGEDDR